MPLFIPFANLTAHAKTVAPRRRRYWRDCRNLPSNPLYRKPFRHAGCIASPSRGDVANSPPNCSRRSHLAQSDGCLPADTPQSCPLATDNVYRPAILCRYPGSVSATDPCTLLQSSRPPAYHARYSRSGAPIMDKPADKRGARDKILRSRSDRTLTEPYPWLPISLRCRYG